MKRFNQTRNSGATMVETAIGIGLFFFIIFAFIDFSRIIIVQTVLTKGAQDGLFRASLESGMDITTNDLSDGEAWNNFITALDRITSRSLEAPLQSIVHRSGSGNAVELVPFRRSYAVSALNPFHGDAQNFTSDVVILRPGEMAQAVDGTAAIRNPDVDPMPSELETTPNMALLLKENPMLVELRARVQTFTPFLGTVEVSGRALGFREQAQPFSAPVELPFGDPFLTPQPTFTPASTATPGGTAVPTVTPGGTPPPTPDLTPTPTPIPPCGVVDLLHCAAQCPGCIPERGNCTNCIDGAAND